MKNPAYLGSSTLEISTIAVYDFWYDYVKLIYAEKMKCCMDTDNFIVYIKTEETYSDFGKMLKQDMIIQFMNWTDHYLKEKK